MGRCGLWGADGKTVSVPTIMPAGNLSLKEVWAVNSYTVTLNANGGTTGIDGTMSGLHVPTREGHTFNGWFTERTNGTKSP